MVDSSMLTENLIPVFPMKDILIYPQMVAPIFVPKTNLISTIEDALMTENHEIILLSVKSLPVEKLVIDDFYKIGVLGKVVQILKFPDGSIKALIETVNRIEVSNLQEQDFNFKASYRILEDENIEIENLSALVKLTSEKFQLYLQKSSKISLENFASITDISEPGKLADIIATYLPIDFAEKQSILEFINTYERLESVSKILSRELEMLNIEQALQEKMKFKLGKIQKDFILREKMRAIKEELGSEEGGLDDVDGLKATIEKSKLPKYVKTNLDREIKKLEKMPAYTAETSVIRTYIDTILSLPWAKSSKEIVDLNRAKEILDEDHFGLKDVKERILEFLAVKKLTKQPQSTILCFIGPPGVGKTSLARSIARSLNRNFAQVSLGGINDESEVRGHRRTYIGSMPGRIINAVKEAGTKNPVILLDEIEKMMRSHMGDPTAAMLEVLDPAQNSHYTDHYVDMPFDLSDVFFIATANTLESIYKPLKDRLEIINLSSYTEEEKLQIASLFLISRQLKMAGIDESKLKIESDAIKVIINNHTREAGVRELERTIAKICRKVAVEIISNPDQVFIVNSENIAKYLGVPKYVREEATKLAQVGLVHGLAWTEFGGEILEIEANIMPGKGNLSLTGRLGEIMVESAKIAFSYTRSNCEKLDLPLNIQEIYDVHIHAADGATPKDGPSAGIALTLAIISSLTKRPVRADIAMTGEITLRGRILPIGGIKEKCIAALRNNIETIIIPKANDKDLQDLPDYIKNKIEFKLVENLDEVINFALLNNKLVKASNNGKNKKRKLTYHRSRLVKN